MANPAPALIHESDDKGRFKGSLTSTLVRTLLIFTFIPLALMAGAAYVRARSLLHEQAVTQSKNLLANQIEIIAQEVEVKEQNILEQFEGEDAAVLVETALQADPQSEQFRAIQTQLSKNLLDKKQFDAFLLIDDDGNIKFASNEEWQGITLDSALFAFDQKQSMLVYGLPPLYDDEFTLLTMVAYTTEDGSRLGTLIGITKAENLKSMLQPLNGLAPYAKTYFILPNEQVFITDQSDGVFSPTTIDLTSQEKIITEVNTQREQTAPATTSLDVKLENGQAALALLVWISSIQSGVVLAIDADTVYSQINSLAPFTILLAIAAAAAMGLVLFYGSRRVVKPLQSLTNITKKFAQGEWNQRAEVLSNDEVGQLSYSFNYLADQIEDMYKSLEKKVDERALQIRTAAEVAQSITTITNIDEMLNKTVELLVQQFKFYQASIFLMDRSNKRLDFKAGFGSATQGYIEQNYSLDVNSASTVGWSAANNQARVTPDVSEDPLHLKNELLPETKSEVCVPISLNEQVLGVLDVQSTELNAFNSDTTVMLETLASQIAAAIQTSKLVENSQIDFQELDRLYRSSRMLAEAQSEAETLRISGQILRSAPYPILLFQVLKDSLKLVTASDASRAETSSGEFQNPIQTNTQELSTFLARGSVIAASSPVGLPKALQEITKILGFTGAAILPIRGQAGLAAIIMIGSRQQSFSNLAVPPYENLADLISAAFQRSATLAQTERRLQEVESLASINELTSSIADINGFFRDLLTKIQQIIGDYNLIVAIYDETTDTVNIPFSYENGKIQSIQPFPLGEGLTSILIRTRQPLMMVKDTEKRAAELGAKVVGKPAKSWMGAPMLVHGNPIGALIIQDLEHENAFTEDDLRFFTTVAGQTAGAVYNAQLLEESKRKAVQVEAAAEIARDISGSLNLDELLNKAVNLIRERFNFYHAAIFLLDLPGEFAIIREATGEAGAQLKRQGHKIGVGSKSIVGFVSSKGELLVVSDTAKDLTYYANPLLPDTRAEAAIPLRVGDRILGVLDVQSTAPFAFHEDNLKSLQVLADQLAIAVENSELFAETQEHLSQHRLLHHITSTAASGTTLEEALESAVNGLQVTLGGDRVMILLTDRDKRTLEVKASVGYSEDISDLKVEIGKGVTGWVAAHKRPLRLRNVTEDPRYIQTSPNTRSELAIPLIYRNETLGVINVESEQVDAYSENDEEMLGTLGGSLAAVIANARLLEQIRAQTERERLVFEITGKIRRSTDIQSILQTTASEIARVTGARYTKIEIDPRNEENS